MCGSRVVLVDGGRGRLYVFDMDATHSISAEGLYALPFDFHEITCTRVGNDTFVAFAHEFSVSRFSLRRIDSSEDWHALYDRERFFFNDPRLLLYYKNLLLIADWNSATKSHEILSLSWTDGIFTEKQLLLNISELVNVLSWTLFGDVDRLFLWNGYWTEPKIIYIYTLCDKLSSKL